jgi:nitrite reductase/ring-hydroxylating ferredoxin subunit
VCPHSGGPLADGLVDAKKVICPLHNYAFSLADGACLDGDMAVRTYPVREEDGEVVVDAGPVRRRPGQLGAVRVASMIPRYGS